MGGAFTAVGGDWASATLNPAGLGIFRRGHLQFTPAVHFANTRTNLLSANGTSNLAVFGMPSWGLVISSKTRENSGLKRWCFALGYNQLGHFLRSTDAISINPTNSITTWFAENANGRLGNDLYNTGGNTPGDFPAQAYNTYFQYTDGSELGIINPDSANNTLYHGLFQNGGIQQAVNQTDRGRYNDWAVSFAGNFSDRVYAGITLNIASFNYSYDRSVTETDIDNRYQFAGHQVQFREQYNTTGSGLGATFGVIVQPIDYVRVGASVRSPQVLYLRDLYSNQMALTDDGGNFFESISSQGNFDYQVITPYHLNAGVMGQLGRVGIVTGDVGFTDYRMTNFNARGANYSTLNRMMQDYFTTKVNFRVGAELRYESFYFRAGYAMYFTQWSERGRTFADQPYTGTPTANRTEPLQRMIISGGAGYRGKNFFMDLGYSHDMRQDLLPLYHEGGSPNPFGSRNQRVGGPVMVSNRTLGTVYLTLGFNMGKTDDDE
jgi:hypothetical protein